MITVLRFGANTGTSKKQLVQQQPNIEESVAGNTVPIIPNTLVTQDSFTKALERPAYTENEVYKKTIKLLNKYIPADASHPTDEPEDAGNWILEMVRETGEDILKQTNLPGLERPESLYEIFALAGWPKATQCILECDGNPRMKAANGKTIAGMVDKQLEQHHGHEALKATKSIISRAMDKDTVHLKAKAEIAASLKRIEQGENSETDALILAIENHTKLAKNTDIYIKDSNYALQLAALHGWPRTAEMLMQKYDKDPRTADTEDLTAYDMVEDSLEKAQDLPEGPAKTKRLQELQDTKAILFKDKPMRDTLTDIESGLDIADEEREKGRYGGTPELDKAVNNFIANGGNVNKINYYFAVPGGVIHAVALYGLKNSVDPVMKAGGNLHCLDDEGLTPLQILQNERAAMDYKSSQEKNLRERVKLKAQVRKLDETEQAFLAWQAKSQQLTPNTKIQKGDSSTAWLDESQSTKAGAGHTKSSAASAEKPKKPKRKTPKKQTEHSSKAKVEKPLVPYDAMAAQYESEQAIARNMKKVAEQEARRKEQLEKEEAARLAKQERKQLLAETASLQQSLADTKAKIARLNAAVTRQLNKQKALDEERAKGKALQEQRTNLVHEKQVKLTELKAHAAERARLQGEEMDRLLKQEKSLISRIADKKDEIQRVNGILETREARVNTLESRLTSLQHLEAEYKGKIAALEEFVNRNQRELATLKIRAEFRPGKDGGWVKKNPPSQGLWVPKLPDPDEQNPFKINY